LTTRSPRWWHRTLLSRRSGGGFKPETALSILDHDLRTLDLIDLSEHTRNDNDLQRKKGRIIGENGRTRELIEELSGGTSSSTGRPWAPLASPRS